MVITGNWSFLIRQDIGCRYLINVHAGSYFKVILNVSKGLMTLSKSECITNLFVITV